jgi:gliding motility-associated-like protein
MHIKSVFSVIVFCISISIVSSQSNFNFSYQISGRPTQISCVETLEEFYVGYGYFTEGISNSAYFLYKINPNGKVLNIKKIENGMDELSIKSFAVSNEKKLIFAGLDLRTEPSNSSFSTVMCFDTSFNLKWSRKIGGEDWTIYNIHDIDVTQSHLYVLCKGSSNNGEKITCLVKFDLDGDLEWQHTLTGEKNDEYESQYNYEKIESDQNGNLYVSGKLTTKKYTTALTDTKGTLIKYTSNGDLVWSNTYSSQLCTTFSDFSISENGNLIICGKTSNQLTDIGGIADTSKYSLFLLELDNNGVIKSTIGFNFDIGLKNLPIKPLITLSQISLSQDGIIYNGNLADSSSRYPVVGLLKLNDRKDTLFQIIPDEKVKNSNNSFLTYSAITHELIVAGGLRKNNVDKGWIYKTNLQNIQTSICCSNKSIIVSKSEIDFIVESKNIEKIYVLPIFDYDLSPLTDISCIKKDLCDKENWQPSFNITAQEICLGDSIEIKDYSPSNQVDYHWDLSEIGINDFVFDQMSFNIYPKKSGLIKLTANHKSGLCTLSDTEYVEIIQKSTSTANAFTPNEDGINDIFYPLTTFCKVLNFQTFIYSRWGNILFTSNDAQIGWNGKTNNGENVPSDIYLWFYQYLDENNQIIFNKGDVTIIR